MFGSSPRELKGFGSCCPRPLLIFNDCTFVLQILLCPPTTDPSPCHALPFPSPVHLFAGLLGIGENVETFKVKNPAEGSLLFSWILLLLVFCLFHYLFIFSFLLFGRREKGSRKDSNFFFYMGGKWCFMVCWKRSIHKPLSLSDSLYDSASRCLPSSRQIANVTWQG